jgi:hypothetical protein
MKRKSKPSKDVLAVEQALNELGIVLEVACTDGTLTTYGFRGGMMVKKNVRSASKRRRRRS